jgi:hypothetical protein
MIRSSVGGKVYMTLEDFIENGVLMSVNDIFKLNPLKIVAVPEIFDDAPRRRALQGMLNLKAKVLRDPANAASYLGEEKTAYLREMRPELFDAEAMPAAPRTYSTAAPVMPSVPRTHSTVAPAMPDIPAHLPKHYIGRSGEALVISAREKLGMGLSLTIEERKALKEYIEIEERKKKQAETDYMYQLIQDKLKHNIPLNSKEQAFKRRFDGLMEIARRKRGGQNCSKYSVKRKSTTKSWRTRGTRKSTRKRNAKRRRVLRRSMRS